MTINARIPHLLRELTGGKERIELAATTVGEALAELERAFPAVKKKICREDGSVEPFVNLYVNDEDIRFSNGLTTELNEGDVITILPMIAGG
jgi:MoaD family protein